MLEDNAKRFWPKVDRMGPVHSELGTRCWLWTAGRSGSGYPAFNERLPDGRLRSVGAHRFICEDRHGPLGPLTADHLCRNRMCVNPDHLDPVSQEVNNKRAESCPSTVNSEKDACPKGHPYSGDNLYRHETSPGRFRRRCRECDRVRVRTINARRRKREREARTLGV